jgi:uncharacterized protein
VSESDCSASFLRDVVPLAPSKEEEARENARRARGALANVVDAHTHLFPEGFYRALWRWFDAHGWNVRFRGDAEAVIDELRGIGIGTIVALVYAHKPGVAAVLNGFLSELCRSDDRIVGVGTVMPGEPNAAEVVRDAIRVHRLRGIKLHCHVQQLPVDDPRVVDVLRECAELDVPAVVHTGRMPRSMAYGVDTFAICNVERTKRVLEMLPRLRLVVPHLGIDEIDAYLGLLDEHENLFLDTAMSCAEYFAEDPRWEIVERHAKEGRILYGSDFPITPYDTDRELRVVAQRIVSDEAFEQLTRGAARSLWRL